MLIPAGDRLFRELPFARLCILAYIGVTSVITLVTAHGHKGRQTANSQQPTAGAALCVSVTPAGSIVCHRGLLAVVLRRTNRQARMPGGLGLGLTLPNKSRMMQAA